jgi:putative ABC transport system substrate-binding protein
MTVTIGRRELLAALGGAAVAWPLAARAQRAGKIRTIGFLSAGSGPPSPGLTALADVLPKLGWVEGKNVIFELRYAQNRLERLPGLAAELVRLNVDVIVAVGTRVLVAKRHAMSAHRFWRLQSGGRGAGAGRGAFELR